MKLIKEARRLQYLAGIIREQNGVDDEEDENDQEIDPNEEDPESEEEIPPTDIEPEVEPEPEDGDELDQVDQQIAQQFDKSPDEKDPESFEKAVPDENIPDEVKPDAEDSDTGETPDQAPTPTTPSGTITQDEAKNLIKDTKGKFFTVTFIKKDGTERVMNARLGVKAYLRGGELPYNPEAKGLIPVYDMQKRDYRMINVNTIKKLVIGNNTYDVI